MRTAEPWQLDMHVRLWGFKLTSCCAAGLIIYSSAFVLSTLVLNGTVRCTAHEPLYLSQFPSWKAVSSDMPSLSCVAAAS